MREVGLDIGHRIGGPQRGLFLIDPHLPIPGPIPRVAVLVEDVVGDVSEGIHFHGHVFTIVEEQ